MFIEFTPDDGTDRAVLRARREDGDYRLPVDSLILDAAPHNISRDRLAVAGTLLFAPYARESIAFPTKIGRPVADALRAATGLEISSKISEVRADTEARLAVTTLSVNLADSLSSATPGVDHTSLSLISGERFHGALFGVKEAVIASNAWFLAQHLGPAPVLIAAGVLYSEDLLARELRLDSTVSVAAPSLATYRELCTPLGLDIS